MLMAYARRLAAGLAVGVGALALTAPTAAGAANPFGCRASVGRGTVGAPFTTTVPIGDDGSYVQLN